MSTAAVLGSGTLWKRGDGASPEVFTTIPECRGGTLSDKDDLVEVTHLESAAKEYIYGLSDGSEIPITLNYLPSNVTQMALLADKAARLTRNFRITMPAAAGGLSFNFAALIIGRDIEFMPNDAITLTLTLRVTGAITGPV